MSDLLEQGHHEINDYMKNIFYQMENICLQMIETFSQTVEASSRGAFSCTIGPARCGLHMQPFAAYLIISDLQRDAAFCSLPKMKMQPFAAYDFLQKGLNVTRVMGKFAK